MGQRVSPGRFYLRTRSEEETRALGARLGRALPEGAAVALDGELGAGKTQLVRGLCQGLGVADLDAVASPTFTLLNEYEGRRPVAHFDFYRVESINSLPELGFEEALASGATVLAEWGGKFPGAFPAGRTVRARFFFPPGEPEARDIEVSLPELPQGSGLPQGSPQGFGGEWAALRRALQDW